MDKKKLVVVALLGVASCLMLASCSSAGSPTPVPSHSSSDDPTRASENPGDSGNQLDPIPVEHPLNASQYITKACDVLTDDQVSKLGGKPDTAELNHLGKASSCMWQAQGGGAVFGTDFVAKYKSGLARIKQAENKLHSYAEMKETNVGEYPALVLLDHGYKQARSCNVAVGINSHIILLAHVVGSSLSSPCDGAKNVAEAAIDTLKAGS